MRRYALAVLASVCLLARATPARADGFITPFVGFNFGGDSANCVSLTNCDQKRTNWGVSLGSTGGLFGFEEDIGYAPSFFGSTSTGDNAVFTAMSNLMIVLPAGPVRPYAIVGLGLMRPHVHFDPAGLAIDKNTLGADIGGGVNIFMTHHVGIRGDVRHLHTLQNATLGTFASDRLNFWRGSAGLTLRF
jgi:hypothetical protein